MDVGNAPPSTDIPSLGAGTANNAAAASASQSSAAPGASTGSNDAVAGTTTVDRVDIHPLDMTAALQILVAEVRLELQAEIALAEQPEPRVPSAVTLMFSPANVSPVLLRMFLDAALREAGNPAAWSAAANQLEGSLRTALDRAVATVEQWLDVPQAVVNAARETRGLVMSQVREEPPSPLWLQSEWMWLSPKMERFRRRRRLARAGLTDPDLWPMREDDGQGERPPERNADS